MEQRIEKAQRAWWDALYEYKGVVKEAVAKSGRELKVDNGYGEEGENLVLNVVDDNASGVITYGIDKVRYNKERDEIEFHAAEINYDEADEWLGCYMLGSDDTTLMENIIFD